MNMKRVFILGTMIVTMSFAGSAWSKSTISPFPNPNGLLSIWRTAMRMKMMICLVH